MPSLKTHVHTLIFFPKTLNSVLITESIRITVSKGQICRELYIF